jgi:23S rRNA (cytidine1920-2'-O)/16S rRNA (cytidine1409-2'-O)-methyltransferase
VATGRRRLDVELVRRGLVTTREQAQAAIAEGRVTVGGAPATKAARQVAPGEPLELVGSPARFVSRGGEKLDAALEAFGISAAGRRAVDAGASTGGFTDCLLQRGATQVVAVDVGYGQLDQRLRHDARVVVVERCNVRSLGPGDDGDALRAGLVGPPAPIVVADLSFISLRSVADALLALLADDGDLVVLVKPQFEAGRREVSRGRGIISDPEVWRRTLHEVIAALEERGACIMGAMASPLRGTQGNVEFLVHARRGAPAHGAVDVDGIVDSVAGSAGGA